MSGWFYTKSGFASDHTVGPLPEKEMARLISIGKLGKNSVVCHPVQTNNDWVPLRKSPLFEIYENFHLEVKREAAAKKREKKRQRLEREREIEAAKQEKKEARKKQQAEQLAAQRKRQRTAASNARTASPVNESSKPMAAHSKKDYPYLSQYLRIAEILVDVTHGILFFILFVYIVLGIIGLIRMASLGNLSAQYGFLLSLGIIAGGVLSFYSILWSRIISFAFLEFIKVVVNIESNTRK